LLHRNAARWRGSVAICLKILQRLPALSKLAPAVIWLDHHCAASRAKPACGPQRIKRRRFRTILKTDN
jgi:hypothetical protein